MLECVTGLGCWILALSLLLLAVEVLALVLLLELLVFAAAEVDVVFLLLGLGLTKDEELELAIVRCYWLLLGYGWKGCSSLDLLILWVGSWAGEGSPDRMIDWQD